MESKGRRVPDTPLEPVIGLAEGETRWRSMTVFARSGAKTHPVIPCMARHAPLLLPTSEIIGILPAKSETPPQGAAETIRAGDTR
jgi:hypothetical protein